MTKTLEVLDGTLSNTLHGNTKNTIDKFWSLVDVRGKDECWLWTRPLAAKDGRGYYSYLGKVWPVHQFSYIITNGEIKNQINHTCDVPHCCNPNHLYDGTQQQNIKDRDSRKRRNIFGDRNPRAKLSMSAVREIRNLNKEGYSYSKLAAKYNVSKTTIAYAVRGGTWNE